MKTVAALLHDPNPIHFDVAAVRALGLGDRPVNQGPSNMAYVVSMLSRSAGGPERIRRLRVRFLGNVLAGDRLVAGGTVAAVGDQDGERVAEVDVWLERGERRPRPRGQRHRSRRLSGGVGGLASRRGPRPRGRSPTGRRPLVLARVLRDDGDRRDGDGAGRALPLLRRDVRLLARRDHAARLGDHLRGAGRGAVLRRHVRRGRAAAAAAPRSRPGRAQHRRLRVRERLLAAAPDAHPVRLRGRPLHRARRPRPSPTSSRTGTPAVRPRTARRRPSPASRSARSSAGCSPSTGRGRSGSSSSSASSCSCPRSSGSPQCGRR